MSIKLTHRVATRRGSVVSDLYEIYYEDDTLIKTITITNSDLIYLKGLIEEELK